MQRIFHLRVMERLGYAKIAEQLNRDLSSNPPPTLTLPGRLVTCARPKGRLGRPVEFGYKAQVGHGPPSDP